MNIGIDIDDTLNDLYNIKRESVKEFSKKHNLKINLINDEDYYLENNYDWPQSLCDKFWQEYHEHMFSNTKVLPHAKEVISKLRKQGHKIYIITAREKERFADPYEISYNWLIKNGIEFDELFVNQLDKSVVCKEKNIELFIDDLPKNINDVLNAGIQTIIISCLHNKNYKNDLVIRVSNWLEIYDYIASCDQKVINCSN